MFDDLSFLRAITAFERALAKVLSVVLTAVLVVSALQLLMFLSVADGAQPFLQVHLLMALNFLKEYPTTSAGAAKFRVDPKTYRVWVWKLIHLMAGALKEVFFASRFGAAIADGLF